MKSSHFHAMALKTCFAAFIFISAYSNASAQKVTDSTALASVSYEGFNNDQFAFLMKYDNTTGQKFIVTVTDSDGHMLFNQAFTDKKFSKVFKTHLETGSLTFVIGNRNGKEEKKFLVNTERHMAEEYSVTKLN